MFLSLVYRAENFRRDFGKLHEIRQVSTAPLSLFTATLTNDMVTKLVLNTGIMKENMISISDTPNRYYKGRHCNCVIEVVHEFSIF